MDDRFKDETLREKGRALSAAEQRRLGRFEQICANLEGEGYARADLTIGIVKANVVTLAAAIPLFIACFAAFVLAHPEAEMSFGPLWFIAVMAIVLVLTAVHEGIHGITWSLFSPGGLKSIEFGFMREYLTPYCTCTVPLPQGGYILGALMPGIVLGLIPTVAGIASGSYAVMIVGIIMLLGAGGDALIVFELLTHRSDASEKLIYDHPTQAGCVVFER